MGLNFFIRKESYRSGAKYTIKIPSLQPEEMVQYAFEETKSRIGAIIAQYGYLNFFSVINADDVDLEMQLDFMKDKTYLIPAGSMIAVDEIRYREFNMKNLDKTKSTTYGKIMVIIGYEVPQLKDLSRLELGFKKSGWIVSNRW